MEFSIRSAGTADIPHIQRIEVAAGKVFAEIGFDSIANDEPPSTSLLLEYLAAGCAWVATDADGTPVGFAVASVVDGEGHLDQVSVVPEVGRNGIGRALVEQVIAWARTQKFDAVTLTTFRDVEFNGRAYARMGFAEIEAADWGTQLAAIRQAEINSGIDVAPRIAMRHLVDKPAK